MVDQQYYYSKLAKDTVQQHVIQNGEQKHKKVRFTDELPNLPQMIIV